MSETDPKTRETLPLVTPLSHHDHTAGTPSEHLQMLSRARDSGKIFLWMGLGGAFAWWVAAFGGMAAFIGLDGLSELSPAVLLAGFVALAIPGLMLVMAGLLARENSRAAATNAVVLEAAARLLAPMQVSGEESTVFAGQMRDNAAQVDRAMAHALSSMKAMAGEISDERQKLESVSHVTADNARELAERLHRERSALEHLAADIRQQTETMSEAIPRQAADMRDSARQAASDIADADKALEVRLETLDGASTRLTEKVKSLDEMSAEAAKRSEELTFAVTRMEEKLEQSRQMVDQAVRAGEMAAAGAHTTGDRLTEAVNSALERARAASHDIQTEALEASEKAAASLAQLKTAGKEAAEAVRAARAEAETAPEKHPSETPADETAEQQTTPPHQAPDTSPRTTSSRGPSQPRLEEDDVFEDDTAAKPAPSSSRNDSDDDLFGSGDTTRTDYSSITTDKDEEGDSHLSVDRPSETNATAAHPTADGEPDSKTGRTIPFLRKRTDRHPPYLKPVGGTQAVNLAPAEQPDGDEENDQAGETALDETQDSEAATSEATSQGAYREDRQQWSDILADMGGNDDNSPMPREAVAEAVINKLMESGVRLGDIFRPRDKKKIASAARKGAGLRRKAVVDTASQQVQRVQNRLDSDRQLMHMAREFLAMEEPDALTALEKTARSSRNASARLSAFMLIDAALG